MMSRSAIEGFRHFPAHKTFHYDFLQEEIPMSTQAKDIEALRQRIYDFVIRIVNLVKQLPNTLIVDNSPP